jgi:hypothetical protein
MYAHGHVVLETVHECLHMRADVHRSFRLALCARTVSTINTAIAHLHLVSELTISASGVQSCMSSKMITRAERVLSRPISDPLTVTCAWLSPLLAASRHHVCNGFWDLGFREPIWIFPCTPANGPIACSGQAALFHLGASSLVSPAIFSSRQSFFLSTIQIAISRDCLLTCRALTQSTGADTQDAMSLLGVNSYDNIVRVYATKSSAAQAEDVAPAVRMVHALQVQINFCTYIGMHVYVQRFHTRVCACAVLSFSFCVHMR